MVVAITAPIMRGWKQGESEHLIFLLRFGRDHSPDNEGMETSSETWAFDRRGVSRDHSPDNEGMETLLSDETEGSGTLVSRSQPR